MKNILILITSIFLTGSGSWVVRGCKSKFELHRMDKLVKQKTDSVFIVRNQNSTLILQLNSLTQDSLIATHAIEGLQSNALAQRQTIKAKDIELKTCRNWQANAIKTGVARVDTLWLNIFGNEAKRKNRK